MILSTTRLIRNPRAGSTRYIPRSCASNQLLVVRQRLLNQMITDTLWPCVRFKPRQTANGYFLTA
jgi:hypothetical protein